MSSVAARSAWIAASALLALVLAACDAKPDPTNAEPAQRPKDALRELIAAWHRHDLASVQALLLPDRAASTIDTLLATREFLSANDALVAHVREHVSPGAARAIDQSYFAGSLDVLSPRVDLLDEVIRGDEATVAFTVDGRIPAHHARLVLVEGRWRYDPGPGYDPALPAAFRRMAEGLRLMLDDLRSGKLDAALRERPERIIDEVRLRLSPGLRMLPAPASGPTTTTRDTISPPP